MTERPQAYYTVQQAAEALNVKPYALRRLAKEGKIPAYVVCGVVRFKLPEVVRFFDAQLLGAAR